MRMIGRIVLPNVNRESVLILLIFMTNRTDPISVNNRVILFIVMKNKKGKDCDKDKNMMS